MKQTHRMALAVAVGLITATSALASSHREAPFITTQPKVDGTDFYMFRSYEAGREQFVTLIANYQPLQDSYGGPNYFTMDPDALYEIHVDNNGDSKEDLTFQFRFTNQYAQANIPSLNVIGGKVPVSGGPAGGVQVPLANIGGGTGAMTGALNVVETYTVTLVRGDRRSGTRTGTTAGLLTKVGETGSSAGVFTKPVDNIGNKSIPDYPAYANGFIKAVNIPGCATAGKVFVGQRREGFVVNLGQVFDQINLDPLGARDSGANIISNKNITSLALELPTACLTAGAEPVIGGWTTASLRQARLLNPSPVGPVKTGLGQGPAKQGGAWTQVSRLGSPLVNEVVIGITDKDKFNASKPMNDVANFATYVLYPTLPVLVNVLFEVAPPATPRTADLLPVFVTGIRTSVNGVMTDFTHPQGINLSTLAGAGEMLRLNTAFPAAPTAIGDQQDLGFLACDLAGFPNGRRPFDDVVDIALTVVEGALTGTNGLQTCDVASTATPTVVPGGVVNDGAKPNKSDYLVTFPYLNTPRPGAVNNDA